MWYICDNVHLSRLHRDFTQSTKWETSSWCQHGEIHWLSSTWHGSFLIEVFSEESAHTVERAYVIRKTGSLLPVGEADGLDGFHIVEKMVAKGGPTELYLVRGFP